MKKLFSIFLGLILLLCFFTNNINAQERWNLDPRMSQILATGDYAKLPHVDVNFTPGIQPTIVHTPFSKDAPPVNFRPHPSTMTESETYMARNKNLSQYLFALEEARVLIQISHRSPYLDAYPKLFRRNKYFLSL